MTVHTPKTSNYTKEAPTHKPQTHQRSPLSLLIVSILAGADITLLRSAIGPRRATPIGLLLFTLGLTLFLSPTSTGGEGLALVIGLLDLLVDGKDILVLLRLWEGVGGEVHTLRQLGLPKVRKIRRAVSRGATRRAGDRLVPPSRVDLGHLHRLTQMTEPSPHVVAPHVPRKLKYVLDLPGGNLGRQRCLHGVRKGLTHPCFTSLGRLLHLHRPLLHPQPGSLRHT